MHLRQQHRFENSDFAFWAFVFSAVYPDPRGRPVGNAAITHEWMFSEQHELSFCRGLLKHITEIDLADVPHRLTAIFN